MKNIRTKLGLALAATIAIPVGVWFIAGHSVSTFQAHPRWELGSEIRSTLSLENEGYFRIGGTQSQDPLLVEHKIHTLLTAELKEIVLSVDKDSIQSRIQVNPTDLQLQSNQASQDEMKQALLEGLQHPLWLTRSPDGQVLDVKVLPGSPDILREYAANLLRSLQYSLPLQKGGNAWTAFESDANGRYEAAYQAVESAKDRWTLHRERVAYKKLKALLQSSINKASVFGKTQGMMKLSYSQEKDRVIAMDGDETLELYDQNSQKIGFNRLKLKWTLTDTRQLTSSELSSEKTSTSQAFASAPSYEVAQKIAEDRQERTMYEARLGTTRLSDIQAEYAALKNLSASKESDDRLIEAFLKLRAFVYLHPEQLKDIANELAALPISSTYVQSMISAMVSISSPAAQEALVQLTTVKQGDAEAMETMVPKLGFVQNPEKIVSDTLRELKQDASIRGMVDLSYGIVGSQLQKVDKPEYQARLQEIESEIFSDLEAATDVKAIKHHLDVIGNLASDRSLAVLEKSLRHESPEVRAVAVYALRDVDSTEAGAEIGRILQNDKEPKVRQAAAEALFNQRPSNDILNLTLKQLDSEPEVQVRLNLLKVLSKSRYVNMEAVHAGLQKVSESDSSPDVRSSASLLLTQFDV